MNKCLTYQEALSWASSLLSKENLNPMIGKWLLLQLSSIPNSEWLSKQREAISPADWQTYQEWIARVVQKEPYQYIIGTQDFYGRTFQVNPDVLIPRPETEQLVEYVLQTREAIWGKEQALTAVDIGTGSGAIAITLALEDTQLKVLAVDISSEALAVARKNALLLDSPVQFFHGDLLQPLIEQQQQVDLIISNPPYIAWEEKEQLDRTVHDFEPHLALFAEEGLAFYRAITQQARQVLRSPGLIAYEIGQGQGVAVSAIIKESYPQAEVEVHRDYQGHERIVLAKV